MTIFAKLSEALRGARKLEIFIGIAVIAALCLVMLGKSGEPNARSTETEARMARTLAAIEGAGDVKVLINEDENGNAAGVLVVAQGADSMEVRLRLMSAVKATLGTDASRIEIIEMEGS